MSAEEVVLTAGFREKRALPAYKKLLNSSVPQSSGITPGSAEISKYSRRYWNQHTDAGAPLPYFEAYDIGELNILANVCECDFVFYRQCGRNNQKDINRPLQIVADTRLFSTNHSKPRARCVHIVISNEGARRLGSHAVTAAKMKPMLPNVSAKQAVVFKSPLEFLVALGKKPESTLVERLEAASFLDLRSDFRLLNAFSKALGRQVRLLAANCTSRYKKLEGKTPRTIKTNMVEQRTSAAAGIDAGAEEPITLCLQARTGSDGTTAVDAVWKLETSSCGPRKAGKKTATAVVSGKETLRNIKDGLEVISAEPEKQKKLTSHIRRDPCCKRGSADLCESCVQMEAEFRELRKPAIDSSQFLYNPKKNAGASFISQARSLGLAELFPWLEESVLKMSLMSCSALDIETLNVPISPAGSGAGAEVALTSAAEIGGGITVLTKHVPFVIGTTSFKVKAVEKWSLPELIWRMQRESGRYVEFRVDERCGVPSQTDVARLVRRWLKYVERRRKIVTRVKRKTLEPVIRMLQDMGERSAEFADSLPTTDRRPAFAYSVYGRLLRRAEQFADEYFVSGYNSAKFDIIHLLAPLLAAARRMKLPVKINRKGK